MRGDTLAEEALLARECAIDELIDDDELAGCEVLPERPDRGDRHDIGHARPLHRVDVGAVVDVRRRQPVAAAVTRKEAKLQPAELGEEDVVRRFAPGALDAQPLGVLEARQVVEPRPADDTEHRFHSCALPSASNCDCAAPKRGQASPGTAAQTFFLV